MTPEPSVVDYFVAEFDVPADFTFPPQLNLAPIRELLWCDLIESTAPGSGAPRRTLFTAWTSRDACGGLSLTDLLTTLKLAPDRKPDRAASGRRPGQGRGKSRVVAAIPKIIAFLAGLVAAWGYLEYLDDHLGGLFVRPIVQVSTAKELVECPVGSLDELNIGFEFRNMQQHGSCSFGLTSVTAVALDGGSNEGIVLTSPVANEILFPPFAPGTTQPTPIVLKGKALQPGLYQVALQGFSKAGRFGGVRRFEAKIKLHVWPRLKEGKLELVAVQDGGRACRCAFEVFHGVSVPHGYSGEAVLPDPRVSITDIFGALVGSSVSDEAGKGDKRIALLNWKSLPIDVPFSSDPNQLYLRATDPMTEAQWRAVISKIAIQVERNRS